MLIKIHYTSDEDLELGVSTSWGQMTYPPKNEKCHIWFCLFRFRTFCHVLDMSGTCPRHFQLRKLPSNLRLSHIMHDLVLYLIFLSNNSVILDTEENMLQPTVILDSKTKTLYKDWGTKRQNYECSLFESIHLSLHYGTSKYWNIWQPTTRCNQHHLL